MPPTLPPRFPTAEVKFLDTVCQPTKERQRAAHLLAAEVDVMVVIGGRTSNNTHQLGRACAAEGAVTYQIENATELRPEWFQSVHEVGVTAGTSTLDSTIREVIDELERIAALELLDRVQDREPAGLSSPMD